MGDALTAVKLLRDRTGLRLREAADISRKWRLGLAVRTGLKLVTGDDARNLLDWVRQQADEERTNDPSGRHAAHRAARGVRKVRGAK